MYNVALSTTSGGTAIAYSSAPFATGYEASWAIDGVVTFCNSVYCSGPKPNKMFKSLLATTSTDVWLQIDIGSLKNIISLYLSLDESDPTQHIGM